MTKRQETVKDLLEYIKHGCGIVMPGEFSKKAQIKAWAVQALDLLEKTMPPLFIVEDGKAPVMVPEPGSITHQVTVPEGFKLVPIEPTDEMCAAGVLHCGDGHYPDNVYYAMLAAAPEVKP